jgi:hypothetical protein
MKPKIHRIVLEVACADYDYTYHRPLLMHRQYRLWVNNFGLGRLKQR